MFEIRNTFKIHPTSQNLLTIIAKENFKHKEKDILRRSFILTLYTLNSFK